MSFFAKNKSSIISKCVIWRLSGRIGIRQDAPQQGELIGCDMDLAGAHNLNLNRFCLQHIVTPRKTFTENIFAIVKDLVNYKYSQEEQVNYALSQILRLSEIMKFNLEWHIAQKMLYNESREVKHGKKY